MLKQGILLLLLLSLQACESGRHDGSGEPQPSEEAPVVTDESPSTDGKEIPSDSQTSFWTEKAVRKILRVFAYGGQASDAQIAAWAALPPDQAIVQILTFDEVNSFLSPTVDATAIYGGTLEALQTFWASEDEVNPTRESLRSRYDMLYLNPTNNLKSLNGGGLLYTWVTAINKSGLNPFRQRVGLFLTNYLMAVSLNKVRPPLIRSLYDDVMNDLAQGEAFARVLARGATSAAVAMQYGHHSNIFDNNKISFRGNDDFAREFHQLFFRINGRDFTPEYHEAVTIEHTAHALTGMRIDSDPAAWGGSDYANDFWVSPISFVDHIDASGKVLNNHTSHYAGSLQILGATIGGVNAREKMYNLSHVAIRTAESLDNLPVYIVKHFADDNLTPNKIAAIRSLWRTMPEPDLLVFLRAYAVSPQFHADDTYKYHTAFDRNLLLYNLNTVDNREAYGNSWQPYSLMAQQGARVFVPAHDVFGAQTSLDAADNPDIFKLAYNSAVDNYWFVVKFQEKYTDSVGDQLWEKDWSRRIPKNANGVYRVKEVAQWLWRHFIGDDLKNYTVLERAYITAFLAVGNDFGYVVDDTNPDRVFTETDLLSQPYASYIDAHESAIINLDSSDENTRNVAQRNIGLAINFISMTPFMFATGGE